MKHTEIQTETTCITNISEKEIIFPPGELLINDGREYIKVFPSGNINYHSNFTQPLPSLVEAVYEPIDDENGVIKVSVLFFVDSEDDLNTIKVNQLFCISSLGECKLQFFIYCDEAQLKSLTKSSNKYRAYTVNFKTSNTNNFPEGTPKPVSLKDIKVVETFIWNIDPETSRGTETSVQTTD
ncbi:conserved hypothetical protein [Tenacibaculum sp. 190524A02b]|uniref:Uncharacterized protein n=1 Tax=Tenacibaculum vairaonense TaxID=3137860 RepID=A0ABP1FDH2_9FLAO